MKLILKEPIKVGEKGEVTELVFREQMQPGDVRGLKISSLNPGDMKTEDAMLIAQRLCGQPDIVMNGIGFFDKFKVIEITLGFYTAGLGIGTDSSR